MEVDGGLPRLAFGQGIRAAERVVRPDDAGKLVRDLPDLNDVLVLGVARGDEHCHSPQLPTFRLRPGDAIVYLASQDDCAPVNGA